MQRRNPYDLLEAFSDTVGSASWQIYEVMVFKVLLILYLVHEGMAQYIITMKQNSQCPFSCADNLANNSSFSLLPLECIVIIGNNQFTLCNS